MYLFLSVLWKDLLSSPGRRPKPKPKPNKSWSLVCVFILLRPKSQQTVRPVESCVYAFSVLGVLRPNLLRSLSSYLCTVWTWKDYKKGICTHIWLWSHVNNGSCLSKSVLAFYFFQLYSGQSLASKSSTNNLPGYKKSWEIEVWQL